MKFRTEIDIPQQQPLSITHDKGIVMLGSCFTDNIGNRLLTDGFDVEFNPMGPLYNPVSIHNAIDLALTGKRDNLTIAQMDDGSWHCLNFASKHRYIDRQNLERDVNAQLDSLAEKIKKSDTVILSLGTSFVFRYQGAEIVGNCHKFPSSCFTRERLSVSQIIETLKKTIDLLRDVPHIIFTISPIRHTADGLHGNQLSKSSLLLALDEVQSGRNVHYFPAYEIMLDDLRDYRFYDDDMKHPSAVAVDYIYETFMKYYMTPATIDKAIKQRKIFRQALHRPIVE